jgi:hypothetical protein
MHYLPFRLSFEILINNTKKAKKADGENNKKR